MSHSLATLSRSECASSGYADGDLAPRVADPLIMSTIESIGQWWTGIPECGDDCMRDYLSNYVDCSDYSDPACFCSQQTKDAFDSYDYLGRCLFRTCNITAVPGTSPCSPFPTHGQHKIYADPGTHDWQMRPTSSSSAWTSERETIHTVFQLKASQKIAKTPRKASQPKATASQQAPRLA